MGVFLSKPSVTKFSEDGEDGGVGFGVSSMQGWRRGMEDAHVALLDVEHPANEEGEEEGGAGGEKIRMFGVFDGHGGKEVALFVQEHMAEELLKLQEYKGGDFPGALIRVFHRMDELLEAAAAELQRSRGIPPPVAQGGDVAAAAAVAQGGHGAEDSEGADTTAVTAPGESEEGNGGGMEENVAAGGEEDGTAARRGATEAGGAERPGGAGAPAAEGLSAERCREILSELSEFRSRKNPSDLEAESRSSKGRPMLGSGADFDSDEDEEDGGAGRGGHADQNGDRGGGVAEGRPVDEDGDEVLELGTAGGGGEGGGGGGGRKIKMADALELFHRILDIRKDQQRGAGAGAGAGAGEGEGEGEGAASSSADAAASSSSIGGGDDDDASSCPPAPHTDSSGGVGGGGDGSKHSADDGGVGDETPPSAGGTGRSDEGAVVGAGLRDEVGQGKGDDGEGGGDSRGSREGTIVLPSVPGAGGLDDEGEDTFGDSDESEEDDVIVASSRSAAPGGAAGARPRLGLGASLASIVHGRGGNAPTCNLQDHPIQAGCTSVVCLMAGNVLHVANAGDSRAVLCRDGVAVALSHDHKPMSITEKTRIQRAGGFVNPAGRVNGNLNLSRSIGDLKYKANSSLPPADQMITAEPDVLSMEVTAEDRFMILACDGVWDCMTSQECVDFVGSRVGKMSLSRVCEEVMDACLSDDPRRTTGIGGDNMTCIVVLLDKSFSAPSLPSPGKVDGDGVVGSAAADALGKGAEAAVAAGPGAEEDKE